MVKVTKAAKRGLAYRAGIKEGDEILAFDGRPFCDILDYAYADGQDGTLITVKTDGEIREISVKKRTLYDTLGLSFDESVEITPKSCKNDCIFCFINQLPCGMRDSLYIKDDDYRLSFISGTYITCTNLAEKDIQRIIDYKLSPLYVSVHATEHALRLKMLGIKRAADITDVLKRLTLAGIKIHTQIVLVGGVNDGTVLQKTFEDLKALGENLLSAAVVPVGLTAHREGRPPIKPLTKEEARSAIAVTEAFYEKYKMFSFAADEMYEIAGLPVKEYSYYGSFPQIENGVGLIAKFLEEVSEAVYDLPEKISLYAGVITGVSGKPVIEKAREIIAAAGKDIKIDIFAVKNKFFGETVTVSGLVTAGDIMTELKDKDLSVYDALMIPSVMLKEFGDVFLDGVSLGTLETTLGKKIEVSGADGGDFINTIIKVGR